MTTIILNRQPYDGTDLTWNALRLAKTLYINSESVNIFLMNDAVDLARVSIAKPNNYDYDLAMMLKKMYEDGINLQVCGTCNSRCGLYKNKPYFDENISSTMQSLAELVVKSDKVISF